MRIEDVVVVALTAPYIRPHTAADYPANGVRNCVWVRLETDSGIVGWGEAYSGCYATEVTIAALQRLKRNLVGSDPLDPSARLAEIRFRNRYWAMRGIGAQTTSAIEAALWDIVGKVRQVPVWRLLGDGTRRPVLLYASAGDSVLEPETVLQEVQQFVQAGFQAYKMRCGGRLDDKTDHLERDTERVAAAREALGPDRQLFVDIAVPQKSANWDYSRAEAYMRKLAAHKVAFLEEPAMTYDVAGYRYLNSLGLVPTAGGESFCCPEEFEPFFEAGAYGVVQPDAAVVGGPASCVDVIRQAHHYGVPAAIHAWSAGVGLAQNIHAACSTAGVTVMEWPMSVHVLAEEPIRNIWDFRNGELQPPELPGLGVTISTGLLNSYPLRPHSERDY